MRKDEERASASLRGRRRLDGQCGRGEKAHRIGIDLLREIVARDARGNRLEAQSWSEGKVVETVWATVTRKSV
jgi:hypothetical protein